LPQQGLPGYKIPITEIVTVAVDEDRWRSPHDFTPPSLSEEERPIGIMADYGWIHPIVKLP
jgi:hypothetical protein